MKITLRPWTLDDLDYLVRFANNKKIADNLTDAFPHPYTKENGITYITTCRPHPGGMGDPVRVEDPVRVGDPVRVEDPVRVLAIEVDGIPCGSIGLMVQPDIHRKNAEMGYWLAEPYWGKGIMTEAVRQMIRFGFNNLDINRIFARPFSTNIASQRVLEKAGMKLEGRFEKTLLKNGQYLDELVYAIRR